MSDLLVTNIKELHQVLDKDEKKNKSNGIADVPSLSNAFLRIENGVIADFGNMDHCPETSMPSVDLKNEQDVLPCFVDSHTHCVHAATREGEFEQKLMGLGYEEIAASGGGILNSARKLNEMSEDLLFERSKHRVQEIIRSGSGALEIKSGYGLSVAGELKMLRVIRRLGDHFAIPIKSTFLGAHALPAEYKTDKKGYLQLIADEMLPNIDKEGLADYIDVFCEKGFFDAHDTEFIIELGEKYGLKAKIHTNQFNSIGGIELAVKHKILSVDHLETFTSDEMDLIASSEVLPVFLPGAAFFLNMALPSGREVIDAGLAPVLASDFNPGSCPSYSMSMMQSLACIRMRMLPNEAFNASTINAAHALELETKVGSIRPKKLAHLIVLKKGKNLKHLSYEFGSDLINQVIIGGKLI